MFRCRKSGMRMRILRRPSGFTLIEVMMVVAIIGILASIAVPSYLEYVIRARVSEGLALTSAAKLHVTEVASSGRGSAAGYAAHFVSPATTQNTTSIAIAPITGVITVTTTARAGGGTIVLSPYFGVNTVLPNATAATFPPPASQVNWQCMAAGATSIVAGRPTGSLSRRFTPPDCR